MKSTITEEEYHAKIAALGPMDNEQRKAVTCALLGHSRIVTNFFGRISCARCGEMVGDQLGGFGFEGAPEAVIVGHNCPICYENYTKLGWKDKVLCPDPFQTDIFP